MAKTDNLSDFLKDVADSIRTKTGTTDKINAQDFSTKILNISSEPPANMVTTDTEQTITGKKTIGPSNSLAFKNNDNTGEYSKLMKQIVDLSGNEDEFKELSLEELIYLKDYLILHGAMTDEDIEMEEGEK